MEKAIYSALAEDVTVAGRSRAYQAARDYAEKYDQQYGTGLIPISAPLVAHIAELWLERYGNQTEPIIVNKLIHLEVYFATKLTSRFDTTIVLTISLPSSLDCTRSLASAASFIASSDTSAGTTTRAISLPFN